MAEHRRRVQRREGRTKDGVRKRGAEKWRKQSEREEKWGIGTGRRGEARRGGRYKFVKGRIRPGRWDKSTVNCIEIQKHPSLKKCHVTLRGIIINTTTTTTIYQLTNCFILFSKIVYENRRYLII